MNESNKPGALDGIKIIDMSSIVLGPFATLILADLGAEVIKIEPEGKGDLMRYAGPSPTGDLGPIYTTLNRNKKSVALDVKTPKGKLVLTKLLKDADVFFHNVRMAGMERLGFDYEAVREINPDIVYVHCAGYGRGGEYEGLQAFDDLIQGASGFSSMRVMRSGGEPEYAPSVVADKTAGLFAVYATLAALLHRQKTGDGQLVEVPMLETFTFFHMVENLFGETFLPGNGQMAYSRSISPYRKPYPTKDGYICLVPYSDAQWVSFFALGGRPDVFDDPRFDSFEKRTANIEELQKQIIEVAKSKTTDDWLACLAEVSVPAMRYSEMTDVLKDRHLEQVGFFEIAEHKDAGPYRRMRHPVRFSETSTRIRNDAPRHGQDTDQILRNIIADS